MQKVALVARYLLALMMIVFGLNKFIGFMSFPEMQGFAAEYMKVMGGSYIMPSIGVIYLIAAAMLLLNRAVGLATVLLAPIAYNALMFHLTLDPENIAGAAIFVVLLVLVMIGNASKYRSLLT
ncbi:hypothetical protein [Pelagicoccus sp. SDUM812003]|uniref:hypothetical protein n=1 Tax=Pelagicoccus sp. SDUM812003 TaxID=3041267 RepID=UPI00280D96CA|nr:hypothetical protein [Pelagicoccus sp. SDUM812003]MDQ8202331.1 hypothetical protein [Pelagicoccus sp. SDUM812003]